MSASPEFATLPSPGRTLTKYVFIQDDPFHLPKVLERYLSEFASSTAGINIQGNQQGKRTLFQTARELLFLYGPIYFAWKLAGLLRAKLLGRLVNGWLGSTRRCYTVAAVASKHGVPIHRTTDVNSEDFRRLLRELGVEFIVSISGTMLYRSALRKQTPFGIVNCHGALLPKYRGLMPSFWTLANGEREGGVSVHYVDAKLDNGPILVQRRYQILPNDSLEAVMSRSKELAAECIVEAVRKVEAGEPTLIDNPESEMTHFSMPTRADVRRFRSIGHTFF